MSTFTDVVQAATNSLDIDPAVKEEFNARFVILNRGIDTSIHRVQGLVERFGSIHVKDDEETPRVSQFDNESPRINQGTLTRKLAKIKDRISAIYAQHPDYDYMPEVYQTDMNALWRDFAEQMNHVGTSPPLNSNDGRVHISSKSRTEDKPAKSDEVLSLLGRFKKQVSDRAFVFRGGEMLGRKEEEEQVKERHTLVVVLDKGLFSISDGVAKRLRSFDVDGIDGDVELSEDELARVHERAEEVRKRYDEVRKRYDEARKRYDEGWKRAREDDKKTDEDRQTRQFEL